jgi:uncharacterized protein
MQVEINTSKTTDIDWGATGVNEIIQNVLNLLNIVKYEVAYDRTLGINTDFQDMPLQESIVLATAQIYEIIEQREPRVIVEEVSFIGLSNEGELIFKVMIDI